MSETKNQPETGEANPHHFPVVGIGASAGGLEALRELFDSLSPETGMAYVIILHLSPEHKSQLAEILSNNTSMSVVEATDKLQIEPNHVYIIPPNASISIADGSIELGAVKRLDGPPLPIDGFFRSLAEHRRDAAIGVVLSGTGSDGTKGLQAIKEEGGFTFAQKPETAKFSAMPRNAVDNVDVDYVLSLGEIAEKLEEIGKKIVDLDHDKSEMFGEAPTSRIMTAIKARTGIDFSHYKKATINRRVQRRMILKHAQTIEEYSGIVERDPGEVDALYNDLLINVTSFFRDPEAYEALTREVWPKILQQVPPMESIRIWVPGCSSGEEVYSIAISLLECLGAKQREYIIFGTDIDEQEIQKARQAFYPEETREQVSPERLRRFFVKTSGQGYQIRKDIRDHCIFARHNLLTDAPFVNISFISCRNLMIYLDNHLQDRVIPTFHYSLAKNGFLLLGKSESLGKYGELFKSVDRINKIFSKTTADVRDIYSTLVFKPTEFKADVEESRLGRSDYRELLSSLHREVDRIVESVYAPAGVVVDDKLNVVEFRGNTDEFLGHSSGAANLNLLKMARGELSFELRLAIDKARQTNVLVKGSSLNSNRENLGFEVVPFTVPLHKTQFFYVIFQPPVPMSHVGVEKENVKSARDGLLEQTQKELADNKAHLETYMEEQETVKEELRSANEELRASYEELQSINEELQSSREEIQASNEELRTVNDELIDKNREIGNLYNDLINFVNSTEIPILLVDNELRIRRITPMIERLVNVLPSDVGRSISDLKLNLDVPNLEELILESIKSLRRTRLDMRSNSGVWYSMRIDPYYTADKRIDGAVIAFIDVNRLLLERGEMAAQAIDLKKQIDLDSDNLAKVNQRLHFAEEAEAAGRLASLLAHDLKNPLNQIIQAAEMVKVDPSKTDRMLQLITDNAERSIDMIEKLRVSTREIKVEKVVVDLKSVIRRLVEETTIPKGIKLEVNTEDDLSASMDPDLIRRVLDNLVSNAVEAMPDGGVLTIRAKKADNSLVLEVEDTGSGISEKAIPFVFASLYTTKAKGLGLGLAFSKRVVEAHGGTISFRTVVGSGTTFTVTLPSNLK